MASLAVLWPLPGKILRVKRRKFDHSLVFCLSDHHQALMSVVARMQM